MGLVPHSLNSDNESTPVTDSDTSYEVDIGFNIHYLLCDYVGPLRA